MNIDHHDFLADLLSGTADALDIPLNLHQSAVDKYEHIGRWLLDNCGAQSDVEIYPQGSFRLGTVIRPIAEEDDYDIDLVFRQNLEKSNVTQEKLKIDSGRLLGKFLSELEFEYEAPKLVERGRCWTLVYKSDGFHLDVLPVIPDPDGDTTSILLTDRDLLRWQHSDPVKYADWFRDRTNQIEFIFAREMLAKSMNRSIQEVPENLVRTPLQRAVQILKRHRDLYFIDDCDNRTPSIIVTTIAGLAYAGERNLYDVVTHIAATMPDCVENRNGTWWIPNPSHPEENFADKWNTHGMRRQRFIDWSIALSNDLRGAEQERGIDRIAKRLASSFGPTTIEKAIAGIGKRYSDLSTGGKLAIGTTGLLTTAGANRVRPHTFHGPRPH